MHSCGKTTHSMGLTLLMERNVSFTALTFLELSAYSLLQHQLSLLLLLGTFEDLQKVSNALLITM